MAREVSMSVVLARLRADNVRQKMCSGRGVGLFGAVLFDKHFFPVDLK